MYTITRHDSLDDSTTVVYQSEFLWQCEPYMGDYRYNARQRGFKVVENPTGFSYTTPTNTVTYSLDSDEQDLL